MLVLWKSILGKVNILSNYLQSSKIDLMTAHDIMVLTSFTDISSLRKYEHFSRQNLRQLNYVNSLEGLKNLSKDVKKKKMHDESKIENIIELADKNFKEEIYYNM